MHLQMCAHARTHMRTREHTRKRARRPLPPAPRPFNYFCFGAGVSEVELDVLTGDFHVLRSDLVMDVGNPLNPAIDIGQVRGHASGHRD